jgi:UDP-N-acetylmuramate dehydrogenase
MIFHDFSPLVYADASVRKEDFVSACLENGLEGVEFMAGIPGCIGGGIAMNAGTLMGSFSDILTDVDILDMKGEIKKIPVSREMSSYRRLHLPEYVAIMGGHFKLQRSADVRSAEMRVGEILKDREGKHPLEYPSAGSVFKNPEGHSSWKLINDAGLKGVRIGGACISAKHTNFIINECNATSSDIHRLIIHVQETVERKFGIHLEPEVKMIGEF